MYDISSRELMKLAFLRQNTPRIPTMPQICHGLPIQIEATQSDFDWRIGYCVCAKNPQVIYDYVLELANRVGCDGVRLFALPDPLNASLDGEDVIVFDPKTYNRIGKLDLHGGRREVKEQAAMVAIEEISKLMSGSETQTQKD